jgi:signal transduction histidine kinase/ligand-binding sensor domain-containing protein/DNA-binding response OmpR family regulator
MRAVLAVITDDCVGLRDRDPGAAIVLAWLEPRYRHPSAAAPVARRTRPLRARLRAAAMMAGALACTVTAAAAQPAGTARPPGPGPETFVHESWTVEDGLPVNSVNALLQSRDGYLWIATFDGLVRFDGVRFTVFNSANSPGLPSARIVVMLEARDGALWLGTEQGHLIRFRDGQFTHFGADRGMTGTAWELHEDRDGTLWVGTRDGLGSIRGERFLPEAGETIRTRVTAIADGSDGALWIGTLPAGLVRIAGGRATSVLAARELAPARQVTSLYEDPDGSLWIGTDAALWRYHDSLERLALGDVLRFARTAHADAMWVLMRSRVWRVRGREAVSVLERKETVFHRPHALLADDAGRMLYTSGAELHREGPRIFTLPPDRSGRRTGLQTITAVTRDHEGSLWLGTFGAGLHRLKPAAFTVLSEPEGLSHRNVYSVYEDRDGTVWIGTLGNGTNRMADRRIERVPDAHGFPGTTLSLLQDRAGRLWVGGGGTSGVCVRAPALERCVRPVPDPIGDRAVLAIHEEPDGALWFGTDGGLFRFADGRWHRFAEAAGAPAFAVRAFQRSRDGALWMGTNGGGLARYHRGRFSRVTTAEGLPIDLVRALNEDRDGWLWVGTEGRGLSRLDPREWAEGRRGRIVTYRISDGLFDELIHLILVDDHGRLWMSSNRGIFWVERAELLDFAAGRISRISSIGYTERDGLRNREANGGSQPAGIKARDGRLWFATQDGVAVVDPARIQSNGIPPNVVIEQVKAGGTALRPGGGALELGAEQRDLEIEYTALSLLAPANVHFRYRLEPYDRQWVEAGDRRTAYYTRVPPGRYTFRVIASNNDGVWNEEGATLVLDLAPGFSETGAFRLLVALALVLAVAGGAGWRVRNLRERTRELARVVEERTAALQRQEKLLQSQNATLEAQAGQLHEMDRAKSHFFANVSHEFRTALTLTIGPLEDLGDLHEAAGSEPPRQVGMALRNSQRLLRLVNQVLDVARLEAGQMKLRARAQDLVGFARGVAAAFTPVAERTRITLDVVAPTGAIPVWFDPDAMEKVLGNLLANAFKFTPEDGRIELRIEAEPHPGGTGAVRLQVHDSGPGIPPEHLAHVFERFYRVDETSRRAQPGTGIGLALAKDLVELHGGSIAVESTPLPPSPFPTGGEGANGAGTVFTVTLPRGRAHLRADQIVAEPDAALVREDGTLAVRVELAPAPPPVAVAPRPAEDVPTLLVVDDSADLRAYVRAHFEVRYRVVEAADGGEGIEAARALLPDVVISDVMMPGTDGHELCRTLKQSPETDFIPVILLSARASTDDRVAGLVGGADDYLGKPFEMRELAARVENLILLSRRLRERYANTPPEPAPAPPAAALAPADRAFVERLRAAIATHLAEPGFGVAELARALFTDRSHLSRRTRDLLGEAPSELIRRLRLEHAAGLLAGGAGSVAEVAYGVGFNSVSYFCRCFREVYGLSPAEYRGARAAAR